MKFSRQSINSNITSLNNEAEIRDMNRRIMEERIPRFENQISINKKTVRRIDENTARAAKAAVINEDNGVVTVIAYSSRGKQIEKLINELKADGKTVNLFLTPLSKLQRVWLSYEKVNKKAVLRKQISGVVTLEKEDLDRIGRDAKTIKDISGLFDELGEGTETQEVVANILGSSLLLGASDIHIEIVSKTKSRIRFRIDGVLIDVSKIPTRISSAITRRIKLLSKLKLNISDSPQDGRFTIRSEEGDIEVRSSLIPSEYGESITLRVLDPKALSTTIEDLGMRDDQISLINRELKEPNGMILLTGPTGSGKTTTLYTFLRKVQSPEIKIVTIEDPIEYHLVGIEQTQINKTSGYSFAKGIKSVLRQDPDILLIGEIRDMETAEVAIQASLTGHLVLSTLHTNNAAGAIPRLIDLGAKPNVIGPAITLVIAQRLIRRLCTKCSQEDEVSNEINANIEKFITSLPKKVSRENIGRKFYKAVGCDECHDGYRGRIAISELLVVDDEIESIVKEGQTESAIEKIAIEKQGMVLIQNDGIIKALEGVTTLDEVKRETGPILW